MTDKNAPSQSTATPARANELRVGQRRSIVYVRSAETVFLTHDDVILCGLGNSMFLYYFC
jgi:hypothetical protein